MLQNLPEAEKEAISEFNEKWLIDLLTPAAFLVSLEKKPLIFQGLLLQTSINLYDEIGIRDKVQPGFYHIDEDVALKGISNLVRRINGIKRT